MLCDTAERGVFMKIVVDDPVLGQIVYTENEWTGKKTLSVNGVVAMPASKKSFMLDGKLVTLAGNYASGLRLCIGANTVTLTPKPKWYELVMAALPLVFLLIWGNSRELCAIFPVVGGAIGGGIGGLFAMLSLLTMKKVKSPIFKVMVGLGICAGAVLVGFAIAIAILSAAA